MKTSRLGGRADGSQCTRAHTLDAESDNVRPRHLVLAAVVGTGFPFVTRATTAQRPWRRPRISFPERGLTSPFVFGGLHVAGTKLGVETEQPRAVVPNEFNATDDFANGRLFLDLLIDEPLQQRNRVDITS